MEIKIHQYQQNKQLHLFSNDWKKKTTTYVDGNPVPGLGLAQKCIGSKLKNGITTLCLLDNWIYNDNTDINKQKMSA